VTLARIRGKGQVTLPDDIRRAARLAEGDYLEVSVEQGSIVMRPKKLIDADQAWFWTEEWQRGEREAADNVATDQVTRYESADDFLRSLDE
jgi:AbrB family looped-hinge helix DNA binding protein